MTSEEIALLAIGVSLLMSVLGVIAALVTKNTLLEIRSSVGKVKGETEKSIAEIKSELDKKIVESEMRAVDRIAKEADQTNKKIYSLEYRVEEDYLKEKVFLRMHGDMLKLIERNEKAHKEAMEKQEQIHRGLIDRTVDSINNLATKLDEVRDRLPTLADLNRDRRQ